jgi:uncharacterized protein (TIGR03382 family)
VLNLATQTTIRLSVFASIALTAGLTAAQADVIQPTTTLPPPTGSYSVPTVCIAPVCLEDIRFFGFQNTSDVPSGPDELVSTNALLSAEVFQNAGGSPGSPLGSISGSGTMDITYFGRAASIPLGLGLFSARITSLDFTGSFNGHTFQAILNPDPLKPSTGQTEIEALSGNGPFRVSSFFDVFAELSIDSAPFVPGALRSATLTGQAPEPASTALAAFGLLGLFGWASRRRRAL